MAHRERLRVVFADVDLMGHVNNAQYFTYFETARTHYYQRLAGLPDLRNLDIIVAKATCEFLRGLTCGEEVEVAVWPTRVGTTSFTFAYAIVDAGGAWAARGETVQVSYDYDRGVKKPIAEALRRALEQEREIGPGMPVPA